MFTKSKRLCFFWGHLSFSVIIAIILITLVFYIWYPAPLSYAEGVIYIFLMLLVIDVIIGPALGWLVYKEGKKTLKIDLFIIIVIQTLAMLYGVYSIFQSRPAWIVQNGGIFQLVRANTILPEDQTAAKQQYQKNSWLSPQWVAIDNNHPKYNYYGEQTLVPNLYTDLNFAKSRIQNYAKPFISLKEFNSEQEIEKNLDKYPEADAWMPLRTTGAGLVVLVNREQGQVVKVVNLRPWK